MPATTRSIRRLSDGTLLRNRLPAALPRADYDRIASHYGRIRIVKRKGLEAMSCECYGVIRAHFVRLGL